MPPGVAAADRRVLFFGDSFVTGFGDPEGLGWVGRVAAASASAGEPITVYNLGVRGETSTEAAARWRAEAELRIDPEVDSRAVFSFGANDTRVEWDGSQRVGPAESLAALERVLDEAAAWRLAPFVVGPGPAGPPDQRERIREISDAYATACESRGVPFVDVLGALGESAAWSDEAAAGDGVHPGAGGYAEAAHLVLAGGWLDWLRGTRA